jgi:hypothetical protein
MTQIDGEPKIAPAALGAMNRGNRKTKPEKNEGEGGLESLLTPK